MKTTTAAVIGLALLAGPALAQSTSTPAKSPSTSTTSQPAQNASTMSLWQGSKLIGLDVYDPQNQKIGDINEILLDKDGKVQQVAIGVGGFLGMGEHDVAVKWTDLKFSDQPVPSSTTTSSNTSGNTMSGGAARTTGSAASTSASTGANSGSQKNYPDHAVLNATKDQLKAMPQFNYSK